MTGDGNFRGDCAGNIIFAGDVLGPDGWIGGSGQSALFRQVMIASSIIAVDTPEYGVFDENALSRFHRNRHTCRNGLTDEEIKINENRKSIS